MQDISASTPAIATASYGKAAGATQAPEKGLWQSRTAQEDRGSVRQARVLTTPCFPESIIVAIYVKYPAISPALMSAVAEALRAASLTSCSVISHSRSQEVTSFAFLFDAFRLRVPLWSLHLPLVGGRARYCVFLPLPNQPRTGFGPQARAGSWASQSPVTCSSNGDLYYAYCTCLLSNLWRLSIHKSLKSWTLALAKLKAFF